MNLPLTAARSIMFQHHPTMTACWIWVGRTNTGGGGRLYIDGREYSARQAIYKILVGAPPSRLKPRCGQHACVNPHHMEER